MRKLVRAVTPASSACQTTKASTVCSVRATHTIGALYSGCLTYPSVIKEHSSGMTGTWVEHCAPASNYRVLGKIEHVLIL